jgi:hypothetical protein
MLAILRSLTEVKTSVSDHIIPREDFLRDVKHLASVLIKYKQIGDERKLYYDKILTLKDDVLNKGRSLGIADDMIVQMLYDKTKETLSEWYIRRVFSDDFNRTKLPNKLEHSGNASKKVTVEYSNTGALPERKSIYKSQSIVEGSPNLQSQPQDEVDVTFDLMQAWEMGLKEAVDECQKSDAQSWIIKIRVKDWLLKRIENEITGFVREDLTL